MKKVIIIGFIMLIGLSCHQKKDVQPKAQPTSIAQKIANAHGYDQWKHVSQIEFTFNGNRSWIWKPKTNDVTLISKADTISYNRNSVDSLSLGADKRFINDKFWLLVPFQLVWDKSTTISEPIKTNAPISKMPMNKITLTYPNDGGGYTPGDAYDLYYDDTFLIKEWVFRRGNSEEPSIINTFEDYKDFNGIKIALEHKKADPEWNLNFSNIKVTLE